MLHNSRPPRFRVPSENAQETAHAPQAPLQDRQTQVPKRNLAMSCTSEKRWLSMNMPPSSIPAILVNGRMIFD
jgi:hypothetical protein